LTLLHPDSDFGGGALVSLVKFTVSQLACTHTGNHIHDPAMPICSKESVTGRITRWFTHGDCHSMTTFL
jgi:hypothetical protein